MCCNDLIERFYPMQPIPMLPIMVYECLSRDWNATDRSGVHGMCDFQDVWAIDNMKISSTLPADWESTSRWSVFSKAVQTRIKADQCCLDCGGCLSPHKVRKLNMQPTKPCSHEYRDCRPKLRNAKISRGLSKSWTIPPPGICWLSGLLGCSLRSVALQGL